MIPKFTLDEFITGERFQACCDIDLDTRTGDLKEFAIPESLRDKKVIKVFIQAHNLNHYVPILAACKDYKFVVVTQNSDGGIVRDNPRDFDYQWRGSPDNIVHWFCQNCEIDTPDITPIPIALENSYVYPKAQKQKTMLALMQQEKPQSRLFHLCCNVWTNPADRMRPYELFRNQPWATVRTGLNGRGFFEFIADVADHFFICSPDGNGSDCVRTWEALYLGCVPIVMPHAFNSYFSKYLPMLVVPNYEGITPEMLIAWKDAIQAKMAAGEYDLRLLTMSYWRNKIDEAAQC